MSGWTPELDAALEQTRSRLIAEQDPRGCWTGELASSALATAVAACALARVGGQPAAVARALDWLAANANPDGGWGDTTDSPSNLPTTLLVWAAFAEPWERRRLGGSEKAAAGTAAFPGAKTAAGTAAFPGAEAWICRCVGSTEPAAIADAVAATYGRDLTFTAPLLALLALMGRLGPEPACWDQVAQLPLELVALPHRLWPRLRLGVVSYGLPALIAVGLLRHRRRPGPLAALRRALTPRALRILAAMWPEGPPDAGRMTGGYNEAPPLVGFVALGLAGAGEAAHPVAQRCAAYLRDWQRADGSWSVEADVRGWLTSLAVAGLAPGGIPAAVAERARGFLLASQRRQADPTTHAAPGGWAWNDLPGAMPDGDDTAGAVLALHQLGGPAEAAAAGCAWLAGIQNRDGGIPTFCRGWSGLPFDRSCPDLTAHALRAWTTWRPVLGDRHDRTMARARAFLQRTQRPDGAWLPLWFGSQQAADRANPVYGTAQVVRALDGPARDRGLAWLAAAQGADGGWGGAPGLPPSLEETALAVAALAGGVHQAAALRGARWLAERSVGDTTFSAAPIGLYFAQLWYRERLYPLVWTALALGRVREAERTNEK